MLTRRKETRKRNISFHLPAAIPFNPTLRLLENDASYITMQDVYDQRCEEIGISREDPILLFGDKGKSVMDPGKQVRCVIVEIDGLIVVYTSLTMPVFGMR